MGTLHIWKARRPNLGPYLNTGSEQSTQTLGLGLRFVGAITGYVVGISAFKDEEPIPGAEEFSCR